MGWRTGGERLNCFKLIPDIVCPVRQSSLEKPLKRTWVTLRSGNRAMPKLRHPPPTLMLCPLLTLPQKIKVTTSSLFPVAILRAIGSPESWRQLHQAVKHTRLLKGERIAQQQRTIRKGKQEHSKPEEAERGFLLTLGEPRLNFQNDEKNKWDGRLKEMKKLVWESEISFSRIYDEN